MLGVFLEDFYPNLVDCVTVMSIKSSSIARTQRSYLPNNYLHYLANNAYLNLGFVVIVLFE